MTNYRYIVLGANYKAYIKVVEDDPDRLQQKYITYGDFQRFL